MRTRFKATMGGAAAITAAALIVGMPSASSAPQTKSYAYGVALAGQGQQPYAEYPKGPTSGGGNLPAQLGPLAAGGVLTVTAGNDRATAKVTNLTLGQAVAGMPQQLKDGISQLTAACTVFDQAGGVDAAVGPLNDAIDQIPGIGAVVNLPTAEEASAFCNSLLDADILSLAKVGTLLTSCKGDSGGVNLTDVEVLGAKQPVLAGDVPKETQLLPAELAPVAKITLNHQYTNDKGGFVVEGLRVEVGGQLVAVVASTTCGETIPVSKPQPQPKPTKQAPKPTPVPTTAPVTG